MASTRVRTLHCRRGTSLVEVLVACLVTVVLLTSLVPLVAASRRLTSDADFATGAMRGAANQLEALRALPWWRGDGPTVEDRVTDLSVPGFEGGGAGLTPVALGVLDDSTSGYEDTLDAAGQHQAGHGPLLRRWAVVPSAAGPSCRTLIVEVAPASVVRSGSPMAAAAIVRLHATRCLAGVRP